MFPSQLDTSNQDVVTSYLEYCFSWVWFKRSKGKIEHVAA